MGDNHETPEELAESIADMLGIYGGPPKEGEAEIDHPEDCKCRNCFVIGMAERIKGNVASQEEIYRYNQTTRAIITDIIVNALDSGVPSRLTIKAPQEIMKVLKTRGYEPQIAGVNMLRDGKLV